MASVPVIDFSAYTSEHSQVDKERTAKEIDDAFRSVGFVYLKNHGVPKERVDECFEWVCVISALSTYTAHTACIH